MIARTFFYAGLLGLSAAAALAPGLSFAGFVACCSFLALVAAFVEAAATSESNRQEDAE